MSDFVQVAEAKMRQQAYENDVRFNSDVDSFSQQSQLTFANARATMKYLHVNNIKGIWLYHFQQGVDSRMPTFGPLAITIPEYTSVQLKVFAYRSPDSINVPTVGALQDDVTSIVQWITIPASSPDITIVNGLITGVNVATVSVYAKLGSFITQTVVITVAS